MTHIEFHLLNGVTPLDYACLLVTSLYRRNQTIHLVGDEPLLHELNQKLWHFDESAFIAHELYSSGKTAPVLLANGEQEPKHDHTLISISDITPKYFSRFRFFYEIVADDEANKQKSRERYKAYRDKGYPLEHKAVAGLNLPF